MRQFAYSSITEQLILVPSPLCSKTEAIVLYANKAEECNMT